MGGWNSVLDASLDRQAQHRAQRTGFDMLQRQFHASQLDNMINAPLPDPNNDPQGYKKAFADKQWALAQREKVYSPEHHATLIDSLHGLITGKQSGGDTSQQSSESTAPISSQAPQMPATNYVQPTGTAPQMNELGTALAAAATPPPTNELGDAVPDPSTVPPVAEGGPFANNPEYAKFHQGLSSLGNTIKQHLQAAAHPVAPQASWDANRVAEGEASGAQVARQLELAAEQRKNRQAMDLEAAKAASAANVAGIRKKPVLKLFSLPNGTLSWVDPTDPDNIPEGATAVNPNSPKFSVAARPAYIRAKYGDNPTPEQILAGTAEYNQTYAGTTSATHEAPIVGADGVVHIVPVHSTSSKTFNAPVSSSAPQLPSSLAGPNARLNAKKPISKQVPTGDRVLPFLKATPAGTVAKKAVDTAENSLLDVQKAGANGNLDPVGSQGIVLAWLRGRVNRVTQPEINSVRNLGGIFDKFDGNMSSLTQGTMTPKQYQWFLRSAKDNYDNALTVAKKYNQPVSSQAPQLHEYAIDDAGKRRKVLDPNAQLPQGWKWE